MIRTLTLLALFVSATITWAQLHDCSAHHITQTHLAQQGLSTDLHQALAQVPKGVFRGGGATVPTVVHVVWNTSAENVADQVIFDVIAQMNADFSATNSDIGTVRASFTGDIANTGIQFCLATTDPMGNPTTGITRTQTTETWFDPDTETNDMKSAPDGIAPWDPDSYLNIWICDIASGAGGGPFTVGYAYLPTGGIVGSNIDGLVIDYNFGTGAGDRTATHEIGHYLGLLHPWGDDQNPSCAVDDGFADTPDTDSPTFTCSNTNLMKCGNLVQYENFMDYASCSAMFTSDQASYMNGILTGVRSSLLSSNGCSGSGGGSYCTITSANGTNDGDYIDGVQLGSINNTGSGSSGGPTYVDNTSLSTTLSAGMTYSMDITSGAYFPDNYAAWIDYDQNMIFDASEKLGEFATTSNFETQTISFTVPAGALNGSTRMRVRGVYFNTGEPSPADPCFAYAYGETEDYGIQITGGVLTYCIPTSTNGTNDGDYIDGVVLGSINNTGSGSSGGPTYVDNTSISTQLMQGASMSMDITGGAYSPDSYAAWIDYDMNGTFDPSEKLGEFATTNAFETQTITFTVPVSATLGNTVMRVRGVYLNTGEPNPADPCFDYAYGETEDYGIEIIPASAGGYCVPTSTNGTNDGDYIDGVELASINNTGSGSTGGPTYVDYTSISTSLVMGVTYSMDITSGAYFPDQYAAWIDYDMNSVFDPSEKLGEFATTSAFETQSFSFTVPTGLTVGSTVMRVRGVYVNTGSPDPIDPCFAYAYGETEDYTVILDASTSIEEQNENDLVAYQNGDQLFVFGINTFEGLELFDVSGRQILERKKNGKNAQINIAQLPGGIYVLRNGTSSTRLFID